MITHKIGTKLTIEQSFIDTNWIYLTLTNSWPLKIKLMHFYCIHMIRNYTIYLIIILIIIKLTSNNQGFMENLYEKDET